MLWMLRMLLLTRVTRLGSRNNSSKHLGCLPTIKHTPKCSISLHHTSSFSSLPSELIFYECVGVLGADVLREVVNGDVSVEGFRVSG